MRKIDPQTQNFREIFDICNENFSSLEKSIKDSSIRLRYFTVSLSGGGDIKFPSPYKMYTNAVELYLDGVRQHPSSFVEINPTTIRLVVDDLKTTQRADIYYRESFVLTHLEKADELSPLYTLKQSTTFNYNNVTITDNNVIPSSGKLWRLVIKPKEICNSGTITFRFRGNRSITANLYNSESDGIVLYNTSSNSIIVELNKTNIVDDLYHVGDLLEVEVSFSPPMYPKINTFDITYLIKQATVEVLT